MKKINNIIGLMLLAVFTLFIYTGCEDEHDPTAEEIKNVNSNITSVDKEITQPGDTLTITGTNLDNVFKILLNEETTPIPFEVNGSELEIYLPSNAPLGDVVIIHIFFTGKGLAKIPMEIISPPAILTLSPSAASGGTELRILGRQLHLSQVVRVAGTEVEFTVIDDQTLSVIVPDEFSGGNVEVEAATGAVSVSPNELIHGREFLVSDFDGNSPYGQADGFISSNGNMDQDTEESAEFPRSKYYTFTITDNGTSWGGNIDFYTEGLPADVDTANTTLYVDMQLSSAMPVNVMIARDGDVWGLTSEYEAGWQTVEMPFSIMGSGYGGTVPREAELPVFDAITTVKIQPPATADNANFGETISIDNIKFIERFTN